MTGLTYEMRNNHETMKNIANHTKLDPRNRNDRILDHAEILQKFSKDLEITSNQEVVKGFIMKPPEIKLGNITVSPKNGVFSLKEKIFDPANFGDNWMIVYSNYNLNDV